MSNQKNQIGKRNRRIRYKSCAFLTVKLIILGMFAATTLVPFFWVLMSSFKTNSEIYGQPFSLPHHYQIDAFLQAWQGGGLSRSLSNSLFYCAASVVLVLLLSSTTSYRFAKIRPNKALYAFFSFGLLIPLHAVLIPLNVIYSRLGMGNTRSALIIAYAVSNLSMSIFILTAFMRNLPDELLQAAEIDGCSGLQAFVRVAFPLSKPALATAGMLAFVNCWNDLLLGMTICSKENLRTISLAVYNLRASFSDDYNVLTAGITIMIVPAVVIYTLFQEQVIQGMTAGALKG